MYPSNTKCNKIKIMYISENRDAIEGVTAGVLESNGEVVMEQYTYWVRSWAISTTQRRGDTHLIAHRIARASLSVSHPMVVPMDCREHAQLSRGAAGMALEGLCKQVNLYIKLV